MHRPLREDDLFPEGRLSRLGARVLLFREVDSTNACLLKHADSLPDGTIAAAEFQSSGRGRLGRAWNAPCGAGLLLSVLLHETEGSRLLAQATLVAAAAVCEAIDASTDCRPGLRWPNDVTIDGRKVAGVLAETRRLSRPWSGVSAPHERPGERTAPRALVIGIGINCLQQPAHFPPELSTKATSLEIASRQPIDRAMVGRALLAALDARLRMPVVTGAELMATVMHYWSDLGAPATLQQGQDEYRGSIVDLTADGELEVELEGGGRKRFGAATTTRIW